LISGAIGFIGSHLTKALLDQGHQVIGLDNLSCCDSKNIEPFKSNANFNFFYHDVTQPIEVAGPIDCVIHLASVPSPAFYYAMPIETMTSGLCGTENMLEVALQKRARFLFTSTSEVYGDPTVSPQPETYPGNVDPLGMRAPYDQSKRGAETLIKIYHERYHLDVRIARLFNTYGPHMRLDDGRVITNFIQALLTNTPMTLYGSGEQTRSFSYVNDTVRGLLRLLNVEFAPTTPIQERVFNIGSTHEVTIEQLAHKYNEVARKLGISPTEIKSIKAFDTSDPKQRRPDLTRAQQILQYEPTFSLTDGLEKTLLYFLKKEAK
jgi:dTDP-glucose 4,6-dehydratase